MAFRVASMLVLVMLTQQHVQVHRFYLERIRSGLGTCPSYEGLGARLTIEGARFTYWSWDKDHRYPTSMGSLTQESAGGTPCLLFSPSRLGTSGCGQYSDDHRTLVFSSRIGQCEMGVHWRECASAAYGVNPCDRQ
jgi:hypothetical protein